MRSSALFDGHAREDEEGSAHELNKSSAFGSNKVLLI
jgi:hypothetical protein